MSSQPDRIDKLQVPVVNECFICKTKAVFTITRRDRTLMACNKPACIQKVDNLIISLCFMDDWWF